MQNSTKYQVDNATKILLEKTTTCLAQKTSNGLALNTIRHKRTITFNSERGGGGYLNMFEGTGTCHYLGYLFLKSAGLSVSVF